MDEEALDCVDVHSLMMEYLSHYAYLNTLQSFVKESGIDKVQGLKNPSKKPPPP